MKKAAGSVKVDEFRIRKVAPEDLPFFRRHSEFVHSNAFVVDGACVVEESPMEEIENKPNRYKPMPINEDVQMEGLEIVGEPLEVSMLDEEEMKKIGEFECRNYRIGIADETAPTDINPLPSRTAIDAIQNFQNSDQLRYVFRQKMGFGEKEPKNFSINFFANADNHPERTTVLTIRNTDNLKHSGVLRHLGDFDDGVRAFVNFKIMALRSKSQLRSISYHSVYNALCSTQLISPMSKWPKARLNDEEIKFPDEVVDSETDESMKSEFIPGILAVKTYWKEDVKNPTGTDDYAINYFSKPSGLDEAVITVKPGWLDNRVKGFDRTLQIKFLLYLCECLKKNEVDWPSHREHPDMLDKFRVYISTLSAVDAAKDTYDFVEGLWDFLICCRSFLSLQTILKETYDAFARGVLTSKFVHVDNCSTIALILKTMDRTSAVLPRLDVMSCIQIMIEVGVDRLRRDLVNELVNKKRLPQSVFAEYLKIDARYNVDKRVRMILVAHLVLQTANLINEHMNIQLTEMQKNFCMLFHQFSKNSEEKLVDRIFTFTTKICNIEYLVFETSLLREWSATHEFSDVSGVRSSFTLHLTRFNEFKRLEKTDPTKRYFDINGANTATVSSGDKAYWDHFDACVYSYNQQDRFPAAAVNSAAGDR
ncbi:hypothetical protein M3Y95_00245500 [Aphelenchoides besseyi]|nr:hypothetical protein M3Y95_00245500 [Aphelenchoides besseyi]